MFIPNIYQKLTKHTENKVYDACIGTMGMVGQRIRKHKFLKQKLSNIKYVQHSEKAKFILDRQEWVGGIGWAAEISEIDHQ